MQAVGVRHNARTKLSGQEASLDEELQRRRKPLPIEAFSSKVLQAPLAYVLGREHDGQQSRSVARQRPLRVGAVMGGNGSGDVISATLGDGHSSGVPWLCQG